MQTTTRLPKRKKGLTIIELTVVILVLLSLITILFVAARAWKRGSDRSANILNIRNIQQAVRGHETLYGLTPGVSALTPDMIFTNGTNLGYLKEPKPPSASGVSGYTYLSIVPNYGQLYVTNVDAIGADYAPSPSTYAGW